MIAHDPKCDPAETCGASPQYMCIVCIACWSDCVMQLEKNAYTPRSQVPVGLDFWFPSESSLLVIILPNFGKVIAHFDEKRHPGVPSTQKGLKRSRLFFSPSRLVPQTLFQLALGRNLGVLFSK